MCRHSQNESAPTVASTDQGPCPYCGTVYKLKEGEALGGLLATIGQMAKPVLHGCGRPRGVSASCGVCGRTRA